MAEDRCFCHLNGYKVKDADARKEIEQIKNSFKELEDLENLHKKDTELEVVSRETSFNADAMFYSVNQGLSLFVVDNLDDENSIERTKDDGEYILTNNYDREKHCITVPEGSIRMFRSVVVPATKNSDNVFIHVDKEGEGEIIAYFSTDGGTTLKQVEQDKTVNCASGNQFVIQLKLVGNVTLHNLCWGVR